MSRSSCIIRTSLKLINMPLISNRLIEPDVRLGLWAIQEDPEEFLRMSPRFERLIEESQSYKSKARRQERLAVYALVYAMTGDDSLVITHKPSAQPHIEGWNVSISHTRGFASVLLSRTKRVGVDVEYMSPRVGKIAGKFIREDEKAPDTVYQLIHWCAKEAVYKLFSEEDLQYFDMRLHPFNRTDNGCVKVDDLRVEKTVDLNYEVTPDYVLTYIYI